MYKIKTKYTKMQKNINALVHRIWELEEELKAIRKKLREIEYEYRKRIVG